MSNRLKIYGINASFPEFKGVIGYCIQELFQNKENQKIINKDNILTNDTNSLLAPHTLINKRSSPDISMNADPNSGWSIYFNGSWYQFGGTSCVAPAFSGFLGLTNATYTSLNTASMLLYKCYYTNVIFVCEGSLVIFLVGIL